MRRTDRDAMIYMLMVGAFLTTYATVRGAATMSESIQDVISDPVGQAKKLTPIGLGMEIGKKIGGLLD